VLLRNGYACVRGEAERFIASFYSAIMNPLPQGSGFFSFSQKLRHSYWRTDARGEKK
jgi:hypothetical protein